jgi:soluble lytic murein transglycosylase-like protein
MSMLARLSRALGGAFLVTLILACSALAAGKDQQAKYDGLIQTYCDKHGVDPKLVHSIIAAESDYDPGAVSVRGAVGLMQLMPQTATDYGVQNAFDPEENIAAGVRYLKDLSKTYEDDLDQILAAYNAGPEALKKYSGIPPYPETLRYIRKVKSFYADQGGTVHTRIFRFRDSQGRVVLTNDKNFFLINKNRTSPPGSGNTD